jgi:hypothetical protein
MRIQLALVAVALCACPVFAGTASVDKASSAKASSHKASVKPSQNSGALSNAVEDKAINLVNQNREVKAWLKLFNGPGKTSPKTGGHPAWSVEGKKGNVVTVRVSEDMPERDLTFGFYEVNIKTGKVTKEN